MSRDITVLYIYFLLKRFYYRHAEIFKISECFGDIHQTPHTIYETASHFSFKACIDRSYLKTTSQFLFELYIILQSFFFKSITHQLQKSHSHQALYLLVCLGINQQKSSQKSIRYRNIDLNIIKLL